VTSAILPARPGGISPHGTDHFFWLFSSRYRPDSSWGPLGGSRNPPPRSSAWVLFAAWLFGRLSDRLPTAAHPARSRSRYSSSRCRRGGQLHRGRDSTYRGPTSWRGAADLGLLSTIAWLGIMFRHGRRAADPAGSGCPAAPAHLSGRGRSRRWGCFQFRDRAAVHELHPDTPGSRSNNELISVLDRGGPGAPRPVRHCIRSNSGAVLTMIPAASPVTTPFN